MEANVKKLVEEIKDGLSQQGSSLKDENAVMRSMLNDKDFKADVYSKDGVVGQVCPFEEAREMVSSVLNKTAKIPAAEAEELANNHMFTKGESSNMIAISKEFVNTYLETGRKLSLGKRADSDISLIPKDVPDSVRTYPKKVGENEYVKGEVKVPAHKSIKVSSPCPDWLKK